MYLTRNQYKTISHLMPRPRGNIIIKNHQALNAILYVAEHGCKWRGLPKRFGKWHTIYTRMNRWAKSGVLERVFVELQKHQAIQINIDALSLDSTAVKVHPDGTGALKKTAHKP
jgi:transposase